MKNRRVVLIVADSCGVGGAPDAASYDDEGADTLGHIAAAVGRLRLPELQRLGLGNLTDIDGVPPAAEPAAAYGRMQERSAGKDTTSGHWEIAGLITSEPFHTFPDGFPEQLIASFSQRTGRPVLGNKPASGTEIIEELGPEQLESGAWIVYTSADSVFQIAAHEQKIPLEELYAACKVARELCDPLRVGRIIARPYVGEPGSFTRTYNRHDYSMPPHGETMLDKLQSVGVPVIGVGKIEDIFCGVGVDESIHSAGNADGMDKTIERLQRLDRGLLFTNLIDFDALYGHRRNPEGYARALREMDAALPGLLEQLGDGDMLFITADHGNDPTHHGTDHTREHVPLLVYGPPGAAGTDLGLRDGFGDIAATVCQAFAAPPPSHGTSFLQELM